MKNVVLGENSIIKDKAASDKEKVLLLIPAMNEEGKISAVISKIKVLSNHLIDEILVIDDGSTDNTLKEIKAHNVRWIAHERNQGVGAALRSGFTYALSNAFDIIVVMGGDNQDDPAQIECLLSPILSAKFDFVQGSRYLAGGKTIHIPLLRWLGTKIHSLLFSMCTNFPITDGSNGFRAFRTLLLTNKNINIRQSWLDRYALEPYLYYKTIEQKFRVTEVPVTKRYPAGNIGYSKMVPIRDWWYMIKPLLCLKFSILK